MENENNSQIYNETPNNNEFSDTNPSAESSPDPGAQSPQPVQPDPAPSDVTNEPETVPKADELTDWPGSFKIYKISKAAVKLNIDSILGIIAITIVSWFGWSVISSVVESYLHRTFGEDSIAALTLSIVFGIPYNIWEIIIGAALILATIQGVRGSKSSIGASLSKAFDKVWYVVATQLLCGLILLGSLILFIIPIFFVAPRIYLANYFVVDQNMGPIEAIKASWNFTKGSVGKLYGILGVNILLVLLAITIIGLIPAIYLGFMYYGATAVLYVFLTKNKITPATPDYPSAAEPTV